MHRLIVNADDFGQTSGINRAVLELHQAGVLTSATMMANADASAEAIEIARAMPTLGIGCHIVLIDGAPILRPDQVPSLLDGSSEHFPSSLTKFLGRLFTGKIRAAEIEVEATAQIRHLQSRGIRVDHVDTHMHTHIFPRVLRPILRAAHACGIRLVRNPFEPMWAVRSTANASLIRSAQVNLLRSRLQSRWNVALAEHNFVTTDGTIGVAATGVLNSANLHRILDKAPAGTWELITHPGYSDPVLARMRAARSESRDVERQALYGMREFPVFDLISFGELN